jgi:hypothetical protein
MGFFLKEKKRILIFGSNTQGRHGKGVALVAVRKYGAIYGQAKGLQGRSYGIVTKELRREHRSISLRDIEKQLPALFDLAETKPHWEFILTPIGCGLAGFTPAEVAPLFKDVPENIIVPSIFSKLNNGQKLTLLICGDRLWSNQFAIRRELRNLEHLVGTVIHGACKGADSIGARLARDEFGLKVIPFPADWKTLGKAAGPIRNQQMLDNGKPDIVHAFHTDIDVSKGTKDMVERSLSHYILTYVFRN